MFKTILENVAAKKPLVHNITNYVTVNDCANVVLACGASPIMADDEAEMEDIQSLCASLVINIGTINDRLLKAMLAAGKAANRAAHPVALDPVGAGASRLRTQAVFTLLDKIQFSVIRGNISEIKCVWQGASTTKGVDADENDAISAQNIGEAIAFAKQLAQRTGAVIAITGATDIVADAANAYVIRNGHSEMTRVTGTGCMLTSLIGSFCGANPNNCLEATAAAVCAMGLCGELAYDKIKETGGGTFSFRMRLIDAVSKLTPEILRGGAKIERH